MSIKCAGLFSFPVPGNGAVPGGRYFVIHDNRGNYLSTYRDRDYALCLPFRAATL